MTKDEILTLMATDRAKEALMKIHAEFSANDLTGDEIAYVAAMLFGELAITTTRVHGEEGIAAMREVATEGVDLAHDLVQNMTKESN